VSLLKSVVSVSKSEWDAFLAEHSKLVQRYELLLSQLDITHTRIKSYHERTDKQIARSGEALRQVRSAIDKICEETEDQLLDSEK
jgi:hypothetical protein